MMLVGISCSAGLVVTGFGVRDSMIDTGSMQFDTVQKYDIEVSFSEGDDALVREELSELEGIEGFLSCSVHRVDARTDEASFFGRTVQL